MMLYKENFQQKNIYTNFMDEDFLIINENARKEKIKIFFVKNKKKIYLLIFLICFILFNVLFVFGMYLFNISNDVDLTLCELSEILFLFILKINSNDSIS